MNRSENLTEWQRRVALDFAQACPLEQPEAIDRGPLTVPSELTEADWIAADVAEDQGKAERRHRINDAAAMDLERAVQARSEWRLA